MPFQLVLLRGRSASKTVRLGAGTVTLGRQAGCQVRIGSSQVSRKHCQLFEKKGLLLVKDLGSSNGTFVNGKRIADQQVLEAGDELTVGPVKFRIEQAGAVPAPQAAGAPGDTAVPLSVGGGPGGEEEFEINFDDEPAAQEEPATLMVPADPQPKKPAPPPEDVPDAPAPEMGDEAVADFLLNIELDDDDKA